ncbi:GNAT family acetyltransferase [Photobacterium gaetbulicola]|uniref:GNAT family acetyltransferase n=1 Tax=Photobacterium gaetbulicola TaxID=1295392 RepID=A0A0B9G518_9GAMM|nr:GNAT family N-acetyltransferase [Photobacterium gaetbulicola]KHT63823.1 GNAT family acetyltransferase [Photobacterium gaetbulicola]
MDVQEIYTTTEVEQGLIELLIECVNDGASIGFLPPLKKVEAISYWHSVEEEIAKGERRLFIAKQGEKVVGVVQLALCQKANGSHRAEIEKLMVLPQQRGNGVGRALMDCAEKMAVKLGRSLLVLDTRKGDVAAKLYTALGFQLAGEIPAFAMSAAGQLDATLLFYKQLP